MDHKAKRISMMTKKTEPKEMEQIKKKIAIKLT
jgi:hypothetical protein